MKVKIPKGYDVIWIRVLNDRWITFRVCPYISDTDFNYPDDSIERYAGGFRSLNGIAPDGAGPYSSWTYHQWMPIPVRGQNTTHYMIHSDVNGDPWISGIAFGKNFWNHAYNPAIAYGWHINGGQSTVLYGATNTVWMDDQLGQFNPGTSTEIYVPVIYSGKDKMLYIVEHNNNWLGSMHTAIYVNSKQVDRLRTTWRNPFARHFDSKIYNRYLGTRIPASMIKPDTKFLIVRVDMTSNDNSMFFREVGTHDYN